MAAITAAGHTARLARPKLSANLDRSRRAAFVLLVSAALSGGPSRAQEMTFTRYAGTNGGGALVDGAPAQARLLAPAGLAIDATGNLYITDGEHGPVIRKIGADGFVSTLAGVASYAWPSRDGLGARARLGGVDALALDSAGDLLLARGWANSILRVSPEGLVTTMLADTPDDLISVAVGAQGTIYASGLYALYRVEADGRFKVVAGKPGEWGAADGVAGAARFSYLPAITTAPNGRIYAADYYNRAIREVTPEGIVTTLAGGLGQTGTGDGVGAAARFAGPVGIGADRAGNLYVVDWQWFAVLRKVEPNGRVTTVGLLDEVFPQACGVFQQGHSGDLIGYGVAVAPTGEVFAVNQAEATVRRLSPTGIVSTVAGKGPEKGHADGQLAAQDRGRGIHVRR